jgi:hypothetical protein
MSLPHQLHDGLEELLSPATLSRLEGRAVVRVHREPLISPYGGVSGNHFLSVETVAETPATDGQPRRYVVKRTSPAWDIILRLSGDPACRELLVWQHGLLDRLPREVGQTVVAAARDGEGWALLMRDISEQMHLCQRWPDPGWAPLTVRELDVLLDGLAALHERYWLDPALLDPALDLCSLSQLYASFSPAAVEREARGDGGRHRLLGVLRTGWGQFEREAAPEIVRLVQGIQADAGPFCAALRRYPWTLVHADPNCKNVGLELEPVPRILLLDWQLVTRAPPAVDLAYVLSLFSAVLPISYEETIARYRDRLAARLGQRYDEAWWQPQLDLGLLGQFVRFAGLLCWRMTYHPDPEVREHYRYVLGWWSARALAGAARL